MRELTTEEARLPGGGRGQDFRTQARHDIPRRETPPASWTLQREERREAAIKPGAELVPLHWLPPRDEGPHWV